MALRATLGLQRGGLATCSTVALRPAAFARAASSSTQNDELPAHLNTKRPDLLLKFKNSSAVKEAHHYTSYFLAAGIPAALILGSPVSTLVDWTAAVALPLHMHIGMRSVIVDYVHDVITQRMALAALAGVTVVTAVGLIKFNITDVGLTGAITELYTHQKAPKELQ